MRSRNYTLSSPDVDIYALHGDIEIFCEKHLLPRQTALENVELPLVYATGAWRGRRARALAALERVGLQDRVHHRPNQLSGGMQQRVGLARALTNDAPILLMDEAFSALDPLIRSEMQGELIRLQAEQQRTIIFISHDIEEAIRIGHRTEVAQRNRLTRAKHRIPLTRVQHR